MPIEQSDKDQAAKFIDPSDGDFQELTGLFAAHRERGVRDELRAQQGEKL